MKGKRSGLTFIECSVKICRFLPLSPPYHSYHNAKQSECAHRLIAWGMLACECKMSNQINISLFFPYVSAGIEYNRLGCYRDNWQEVRPLAELLFTDRNETSPRYSGKKYIRKNFNRLYLDDLIQRCASQSKKLSYQVFGIENFGTNTLIQLPLVLSDITNHYYRFSPYFSLHPHHSKTMFDDEVFLENGKLFLNLK